MIFVTTPGFDAEPVVPPSPSVDVPSGFVEALKAARKFTGSHEKRFPAGTYVHIAGDKLYATNNRHLVEIEIGADVGYARLSKSDIDAISAMEDDPERLSISDGEISFEWSGGRWAKLQTEPIAFNWSEELKRRIDTFWEEGQSTVGCDPKSVDVWVPAKRKQPISFDLPYRENKRTGRVVVFPKGVFFRKGTASASALIGDGSFDPLLDDVFAEAIKETRSARNANDKKIERLISKISAIERQIKSIEDESDQLTEKLVSQHEAVAKYQSGKELDEIEREILTPIVPELHAEARREEVEAEFAQHDIPDGWEVEGKRLKDDFIYVTIKRKRVTRKKPEGRVRKKIEKAVAKFFEPTFDRTIRVRWDRLGTLSPIIPGAG